MGTGCERAQVAQHNGGSCRAVQKDWKVTGTHRTTAPHADEVGKPLSGDDSRKEGLAATGRPVQQCATQRLHAKALEEARLPPGARHSALHLPLHARKAPERGP